MAYATTIGDVEILSLMDVGSWRLDGFFPSVPPEEWERYRALYPEALCSGSAICTSATAYAIRADGTIVLVDTGLGPGPHEALAGQEGQLLRELSTCGISPTDVDVVVFTHLHRDHVGWNGVDTGGIVTPTFPRARYLVPEKDWRYFADPERAGRQPHLEATRVLFASGRIELVDGDQAIGPSLSALPTPGHTPGHQAIVVASRGERAAIIGDIAHTPAQVQETEWLSRAEVDPDLSCETRRRTFDSVEADHALLCAGHFPHPGFGYLVRSNGRRMFQALTVADASSAGSGSARRLGG